MKISKVLIANRGEIACRIIRTLKRLQIDSVAVYSFADQDAPHVRLADQSVLLGAAESKESYLAQEKIIAACKNTGADALHPGYGFLSENAEFAEKLAKAGITFIGPKPDTIRLLGDKIEAKRAAEKAGVPLVPGCTVGDHSDESRKKVEQFAKEFGFPLIIKAAAGGGGRGMRRVDANSELREKLEAASREAQAFFSDGRVFVEKLVENARHIEVQIFGDTHGNVIHLLDRDCSMQRNHQKVIEEAPAPNLPDKVRTEIHAAAVKLCRSVGYLNAGTVEFLLDAKGKFYFLEVNSRLQVEHPVTEMVTGLDLVELQLRVASGEKLPALAPSPILPRGAAIECRICAEAPEDNFIAATGTLSSIDFEEGAGVRFDTGFEAGSKISHYYDSLLGKLITHAPTRSEALNLAVNALSEGTLFGVRNNIGYLLSLLDTPAFRQVTHHINFAATLAKAGLDQKNQKLAAALVEIYRVLSAQHELDPWSSGSTFRLGGAGSIQIDRLVNGKAVSTRVKRIGQSKFVIEGSSPAEIDVQFCLPYGLVFKSEFGERCVAIAEDLGWIQGYFGSVELRKHTPKLREHASDLKAHASEISSSLPGKVIALKVKVGDQFKAGDALLSIESMKMEHIIRASADGKVLEIGVSTGDSVEAGRVLLRLELD